MHWLNCFVNGQNSRSSMQLQPNLKRYCRSIPANAPLTAGWQWCDVTTNRNGGLNWQPVCAAFTGGLRLVLSLSSTSNSHLRRKASQASDYTITVSWKAQKRLCNRHKTTVLNSNQVNVAIIRNLLGFLWDIACYEMNRISFRKPLDSRRSG